MIDHHFLHDKTGGLTSCKLGNSFENGGIDIPDMLAFKTKGRLKAVPRAQGEKEKERTIRKLSAPFLGDRDENCYKRIRRAIQRLSVSVQ